jgi:hypothetical protein
MHHRVFHEIVTNDCGGPFALAPSASDRRRQPVDLEGRLAPAQPGRRTLATIMRRPAAGELLAYRSGFLEFDQTQNVIHAEKENTRSGVG